MDEVGWSQVEEEKDKAEEDGNERRVRGWEAVWQDWAGWRSGRLLQRWKARLDDTIQRE